MRDISPTMVTDKTVITLPSLGLAVNFGSRMRRQQADRIDSTSPHHNDNNQARVDATVIPGSKALVFRRLVILETDRPSLSSRSHWNRSDAAEAPPWTPCQRQGSRSDSSLLCRPLLLVPAR